MKNPRNMLDPISPELEALISAAAGDDGPSEETRARLYGRLSSTLAFLPAPAPPGGQSLGLAGKAAALLPSAKPLLVSALVASGIGLTGIAGYMATRPSPAKGASHVLSPGADTASEPRHGPVFPEETPEAPQMPPREQISGGHSTRSGSTCSEGLTG